MTKEVAAPGFRLSRVEIYNWGTFNGKNWVIDCEGKNFLLTGDIGSGKSTVVDAITTLLVPSNKIIFNKAAGAESKERTLKSYVLGYHKSARDSDEIKAKSVALRTESNYSVILACFVDYASNKEVTLAQVLWMQAQKSVPERFYITSQSSLDIATHFSDFEKIGQLKRRLRKNENLIVSESYKEYSRLFLRLLGIPSFQSIDLFYQCVSMKAVGSLTQFVREHMLNTTDSVDRVSKLCETFSDLQDAHKAVVRAREQIEALTPIEKDWGEHLKEEALREKLLSARESLSPFFAEIKVEKLQLRITAQVAEQEKLSNRIADVEKNISEGDFKISGIRHDILEKGGKRLEDLEYNIKQSAEQMRLRKDKAASYDNMSSLLGLPAPENSDVFINNKHELNERKSKLEAERVSLDDVRIDIRIKLKDVDDAKRETARELDSLRRRRSNIPIRNLEIRQRMLDALDLPDDALPFVGELVRVKDSEREWLGVAERLLHNYGLSILVSDRYYRQVTSYVNKTHLQGKIVYYRVKSMSGKKNVSKSDQFSLLRKLEVKKDSEFSLYLMCELAERFDYICCKSLDDFRRHPRAVTREGQIKSGGQRHEKDDRTRIDDPSRYILGWSNVEKIEYLKGEQQRLLAEGDELETQLENLQTNLSEVDKALQAVSFLSSFARFAEIDWRQLSREILEMQNELAELQKGATDLKNLKIKLKKLLDSHKENRDKLDKLNREQGGLEVKIGKYREELSKTESLVHGWPEKVRETMQPILKKYCSMVLGEEKEINLNNIDLCRREVREHLQGALDKQQKKFQRLHERLTRQMQIFNGTYPVDSKELEAALNGVNSYLDLLRTLRSEGLPRHEDRFKNLLREGTIQDIILFQAALYKETKKIKDKIKLINDSLSGINYNPSTYIHILCEDARDTEIMDFQKQLRECLSDLSSGDEAVYGEDKFLKVKAIIERFQGRKDKVDIDKRWTSKVTDVRNWFVFSASERWFEDHQEKEYYSDSSGKSGGQKEKLAYTVLAAALAFKLGNQAGENNFRFVMIDEAFGRGSDKSAQYGLELFGKLGLQLMVVTPLQKIHIIENYVRFLYYARNPGGMESRLERLSLEEYREKRERHFHAKLPFVKKSSLDGVEGERIST